MIRLSFKRAQDQNRQGRSQQRRQSRRSNEENGQRRTDTSEEEVVAEETTEEEVVSEEETTQEEYNVEEDVNALLGGEELSEEFREKAKVIFEAALNSKVKEIQEALEVQYGEVGKKKKV